ADYYYWTEYLRALIVRVGVPEKQQEEIGGQIAEGFKQVNTWSHVYSGTVEYLRALRGRGYFLGVVSNALGQIEAQLQRVGLAACFEFILDSHIVGVEKPHPEIFQLALARCGFSPSEALFVGDLYSTDIGGAQNAGLNGVLIDRVGAYPEARVARIVSLPELDQIIEAQGAL
ncbi:MAG: HAD family hydrolase, partial [Terriglobia bacterium]